MILNTIAEKEKKSISNRVKYKPYDTALRSRKYGYSVFPCKGKSAYLEGGVYHHSALDQQLIVGAFVEREWGDVTVALSTYCFLVIDIDSAASEDGETGLQTWQRLKVELGITDEPTVITPSGGYHYYYRMPRNFLTIKNNKPFLTATGKKAQIDVKGFGGYVMAPSAVTGSGIYRPQDSFYSPDGKPLIPTELPEIPQKLLDRLDINENKPYQQCEKPASEPYRLANLKLTINLLREMYGEEAVLPFLDALEPRQPSTLDYSVTTDSQGVTEEEISQDNDNSSQDAANDASGIHSQQETGSSSESSADDSSGDSGEDTADTEDEATDEEQQVQVEESLDISPLDPDIQKSIIRLEDRLPLESTTISYMGIIGGQVNHYVRLNGKLYKTRLHTLVVAQSGAGKSEMLDPIVYSLTKLQQKKVREYRAAVKKVKLKEAENRKSKKKKGKTADKQADPQPQEITQQEAPQESQQPETPLEMPIMEHYCYNTSLTVQGIFDRISDMDISGQNGTLAVVNDEAASIFGSMNKFSKGNDDWSTFIRIMDGRDINTAFKSVPYYCEEPRVALVLGVQPETLHAAWKKWKEQLEGGFFSRFLYNFVPKRKRQHRRLTDEGLINDPKEQTYEEKLLDFIINEPIRTLRLSDEAFQLYQVYDDEVTDKLSELDKLTGTINGFISSTTAHSMNKVLSVAAIAHTLNITARKLRNELLKPDVEEIITGAEMKFAIEFVKHYQNQLIRHLNGVGSIDNTMTQEAKKVCRFMVGWMRDNDQLEMPWTAVRKMPLLRGADRKEYAEKMLAFLQDNVIVETRTVITNPKNGKASLMLKLTATGNRYGS